jgi:hypothetical protein
MQAKKALHLAQQEQPKEGITAKAPIGQRQVAGFKWIEQLLQQAQLVLVFVAFGVIEQDAGGQAEHADELQEWEAAAGLLAAGLGISTLGFERVGRAGRGAVNDFDLQAMPKDTGFFGVRGDRAAQAGQNVQRQPLSSLTVGAGAFVHRVARLQDEERLDLADDLAAGALGIEDLKEEAEKGAAEGIDALTAVGAFVRLGEQTRGQERSEERFQMEEVLLAQAMDAFAQGGEASAKGWK